MVFALISFFSLTNHQDKEAEIERKSYVAFRIVNGKKFQQEL